MAEKEKAVILGLEVEWGGDWSLGEDKRKCGARCGMLLGKPLLLEGKTASTSGFSFH